MVSFSSSLLTFVLLLSQPSFCLAQGKGKSKGRGKTSDNKDGCDATYSVQLLANTPDNVGVECSSEEYIAIESIIHSVVEMESVMRLMGSDVPNFMYAYDEYSEDVFEILEDSDKALLRSHGVTQKELALPFLTTKDKLEDMVYDPDARRLGATAATVVERIIPGDDRQLGARSDCGGTKGCSATWCCWFCSKFCRRRSLLRVSRKLGSSSSSSSSDDFSDDDDKAAEKEAKEAEKAAKEADKEAEKFAKELAEASKKASEAAEKVAEAARKKAKKAEKEAAKAVEEAEKSDSKEAKELAKALVESAKDEAKALEEADKTKESKAKDAADDQERYVKKVKENSKYDETSDKYQKKRDDFDEHISESIRTKLQAWARSSNSFCLGDSWELQVIFMKFD